MNPMSLLTLPVDALREASQHADQSSPCGERGERSTALVVAMCVFIVGLALAFAT
jgi:hypothetical protein